MGRVTLNQSHRRGRAIQKVAVGVMMALWLVLSLATASSQLHQLFHDDATHLDHQCAVTQLQKHGAWVDAAPIVAPSPVVSASGEPPRPKVISLLAPRFQLPPDRGPPCQPALTPALAG